MNKGFVVNLRADAVNGIYDLSGDDWINRGVVLADGRFGKKGLEFTQSNGYTYLEHMADNRFDFGTNEDFTLAVWIKYRSGNNYATIMCRNQDYGAGFAASHNWSLSPYCTFGHYAGYTSAQQLFAHSSPNWVSWQVDDSWHHIAVTRSGTTRRLFCDGKICAQDDAIYSFDMSVGNSILVGWDGFQPSSQLKAVLDDLCVIKGTALWTNDFNPPNHYLLDKQNVYLSTGGIFNV